MQASTSSLGAAPGYVFAAFAESHRVIRWDRRGYGRSESPTAPFRNLDDVFALMKALEVERGGEHAPPAPEDQVAIGKNPGLLSR